MKAHDQICFWKKKKIIPATMRRIDYKETEKMDRDNHEAATSGMAWDY